MWISGDEIWKCKFCGTINSCVYSYCSYCKK